MLRKTLTSHVDAKAKIEADIPAEAITAGACELNAFALRTELGDKLCGNQPVRRVHAAVLAPSSGEEHRIATPSSRRRVDDVEVDAAIQDERVTNFDFHTGARRGLFAGARGLAPRPR